MDSELLPCPFCGDTEITLYSFYNDGGGAEAVIECQKCWAKINLHGKSEDDAVRRTKAAWNNRAECS
jgi:Lar family restriction alleviation protein